MVDGEDVTTSSTTETARLSWERAHLPLVEAWLEREGGVSFGPEEDIRRSAAHSLLMVPQMRAWGRLPNEPVREAFTWDEIDAYEILFGFLVHGGTGGFDAGELLRWIGSFAAYLGEQGVIPAAEHAVLQRDWDVWSERFLDMWELGGWYRPDGTYQSQEELDQKYEQAAMRARASRPGSRFGRFRRRRRPSRR